MGPLQTSAAAWPAASPSSHVARPRRVRVLFLVEGFTDIRFVAGLSEICELTMIVPAPAFRESRLAERVAASGAKLRVIEIPGGRLRFQFGSLQELWRHAGACDLILSQELLRGSLNANVIGRLRRKPVVTYMASRRSSIFGAAASVDRSDRLRHGSGAR